MKRTVVVRWSILAISLVLVAIALFPEPAPRLLTAHEGWTVSGKAGLVRLEQFPEQFRHVRNSVVASERGVLYRSWTPESGVQPIEVVSPPFQPGRHVAIAVTGTTRTPSGGNTAYLSCSLHDRRVPVFEGSVNVAVVEAIVTLPRRWCDGDTRLHLVARDTSTHVGVGAVYELSPWSVWKHGFLGLAPYLAVTLIVVGAIGVVGAAVARRSHARLDALPAALSAVGLAALAAFYAHALVPKTLVAFLPAAGVLVLGVVAAWAGVARIREAARDLAPFALAWLLASVACFALTSLGSSGLGHWNPNYRFWPATWSSDNELPWMFAEAMRLKRDLADLYGGGWKPTDRPPLMAGAHLLIAQTFAWMQAGADGAHLKGVAFNTAAFAFNALWVPASLYLLRAAFRLDWRDAVAVIAVLTLVPFVIFNSAYGWPKALGAAFGIAASALAARAGRGDADVWPTALFVGFGVLGALSVLAHASNAVFLALVGVWLTWRCLRKHPRALVAGAVAGLALLATWSAYRGLVLPSHDPVTRFALVGDFGFSDPAKPLLAALQDRYAALSFEQWAAIKGRMLLQPLWPVSTSVAPVALNADFAGGGWNALRARDFAVFTGGNLVLLVGAGFALAGLRSRPAAGPRAEETCGTTAGWMAALALLTWPVLALVFFAPLILHHWPYTAVFVLGLAGLTAMRVRAPRVFRVVAVLGTLYAMIVWGMLPLTSQLSLDVPAAAATAVLSTFAYMAVVAPAASQRAAVGSRGPPRGSQP